MSPSTSSFVSLPSVELAQQAGLSKLPLRKTAHIFAQNKLGFSQLVVKIEWGVAYLETAQGSEAKVSQAEADLAEYFDTARVWLEQLAQNKDKSTLREVFEGDTIELLAHLEGLCYKVELKVSSDRRRLELIQRITACNEAVADLGYGQQLREAKIAEFKGAGEETEEDPVDEVVPHLTDAAFLGSQAMAYEQVLDFSAAAETYSKATGSLRAAITVCLAVVKFKASIGAPGTHIEGDLAQLQRLERQTSLRIEHLKSLEPGDEPIPIAQQIEPVELSIHQDFKVAKKMMHAYAGLGGVAAVGVGGILYMAGPFGFALLAGATVCTAVVAAHSKHDDGESEQAGLLEALANIAELGRRVSFQVSRTLTKIGEAVTEVAEALSPRGRAKSYPDMALFPLTPRARAKTYQDQSLMVAPTKSNPDCSPFVSPFSSWGASEYQDRAPMAAPMVSFA